MDKTYKHIKSHINKSANNNWFSIKPTLKDSLSTHDQKTIDKLPATSHQSPTQSINRQTPEVLN